MTSRETPQLPDNNQYRIPNTLTLSDLYEERDAHLEGHDYTGMGKIVLKSIEGDIDRREAEVGLDGNADPAEELAMLEDHQKNAPLPGLGWQDKLLIADAERRVDEQNDVHTAA